MMPPPTLTADLLKKSERTRAKQSDIYYNPNKVYYAPYGSHNNSEYASQSSDTGCTSDAASFTTETTDNEDPRHFKPPQSHYQTLRLRCVRLIQGARTPGNMLA